MDPQEQEHWDHEMGAASDAQNAFAWNKMNAQLRDPEIDKALAEGKFVVVRGFPACCPSTDAYMGERQILLSTHDTRTEAEEAMQKIEEDWEEERIFILPKQPSQYDIGPGPFDMPF